MSWVSFYSHDVTLLQVKIVDIVIVTLTSILELNLNKVSCLVVSRHVSQPVERVQLVVLSATTFVA